jgi:hypothetical protein
MCGIGVKNVPGVYMLLLGLGRVQDIEAVLYCEILKNCEVPCYIVLHCVIIDRLRKAGKNRRVPRDE